MSNQRVLPKKAFNRFVHVLAQKRKVVALDCDVDAPNLSIWLNEFSKPKVIKYVKTNLVAKVNQKKCKKCDKCISACPFGAIEKRDNKIQVNEFLCEGCGVCEIVCPAKAFLLTSSYEELNRLVKLMKQKATMEIEILGHTETRVGYEKKLMKLSEQRAEAVKKYMGGYLQPLFYKRQKGRKKAPFTWRLTTKQIDKILRYN